jgi:putative tryptophan/tyrosine transport system substrate-binding protein
MKAFSFLCALFLAACTNQESQKIPIAILTPITHPSLEQVEKGFKETIEANNPGKYQFVTYNAQGNKTLMRGEVEDIAQKRYPLVFTIGTLSSQMTTEVFAKKGLDTPIVFTCVNDPVGFHIVQSEESPGGHVTGVKELVDFRKELELLLQYKLDIHTVLTVLNPMEPGIAKDAEEVRGILKERGIQLITVEVFQTNEFMGKVSPFMHQADAMLILKDNTVVAGLDILIKLCNQYRIPLVTSELDSPDRGAAFGYGVHEIEFGIEGAKKALHILNDQAKPETIPVTPVSNFIFKVNREAAIAQGILLDKEENPQ